MEEKFKENFGILKEKKQLSIFTDGKYEKYVQLIQLCTGPVNQRKCHQNKAIFYGDLHFEWRIPIQFCIITVIFYFSNRFQFIIFKVKKPRKVPKRLSEKTNYLNFSNRIT